MTDDPTKTVSFAVDIRPLFTDLDIRHMSWFCDLSSFEDVRTRADVILGRLDGSHGPQMPPANADGPWSAEKIDLFRQWKEGGCTP